MHSNSINKILIVGAGAFGRALAAAIQCDENQIYFLVRDKTSCSNQLDFKIDFYEKTFSFEEFNGNFEQFELIIFAIPTQCLRSVLKLLKQKYIKYLDFHKKTQKNKLSFISTSKGIEQNSVKLPHQIFHEIWNETAQVASLSGPSFALEMMNQLPTSLTLASKSKELIQKSISIMHSSYFRLYDTDDVIGVEIGGALKNVIALLAGIVDGLGLGHNAKSAIITLGLSDMAHIGVKMGASPFTFMGLSGLGDLILTCTGGLSRNKQFGIKLAKTENKQKAINDMSEVVEGFATTKSTYQLMQRLEISSDLLTIAYKILYEDLPLDQAMGTLLNREQGSEFRWLKGL